MARYITSVSLRNQALGFAVCWGFGWSFIMHPPQIPAGRPVFSVIGCALILLGLMAVRNVVRLIAAMLRSVVGR
jgi:hypothetical protein